MTRTVRRDLHLLRVGVAGAAAVVLLAACGDGESSGAGSPETTSAAGETTTGEGAGDFCDRAAGIDERVDAALDGVEGDPSLADAFRQIAGDLRTIEAPAAIAGDWDSMAAGLDRMADAFAQVDVTDLDSLQALEQAEGDLTTAGDHVDDYLRDECGI